MLFEEEINKETDNKFSIRFKSATLDKNEGKCFVEVFYKDGIILSSSDREELSKKISVLLPNGFKYEIKFIKNFVTNEAIKNGVGEFLKKNYPAVKYNVSKVDCENDSKNLVVCIPEDEMDYALEHGVKNELEKYIQDNFYILSRVNFEADEELPSEIQVEDALPFENFFEEPDVIEVSNVTPLIGELSETLAYPIKYKTKEEENAIVCGKIIYFKEASFQAKSKKKEEGEAESTSERKYYKFAIEDYSGKLNCVFFPNQKNIEKIASLKQGDDVILQGRLSENKFFKNLDLNVKSISLCTLPEKPEEQIVYKSEPERYVNVFPEQAVYYSQGDLFMQEEKPIDPFFLANDVVVFDFETTGTRVDGSDKIVEIGAVKVVKGKVVETFSCLINPEMKIPAEATKVHGITNDDVVGKPTYKEVMGDFYKFTRGCYLSGYNIVGFDMLYLTHFGRLSGYNFDNPVIDVYKLAQQNVKGVKNYKLGTIAEKLGVKLDHAHRAVFDTIATAEVLFKIAELTDLSKILK